MQTLRVCVRPAGQKRKNRIKRKAKAVSIYHASVKVFSRSAGHSGTAAAAYRLGVEITDARTDLKHNYAKRGGVAFSFSAAPDHAPKWARDPSALWNAAEAAENRKNSCVARELEFSLPHELNADQRRDLAQEIAARMVEKYGVATSGAIHEPEKGSKNFHCHLLMTTRRMGPDGLTEKTRELDDLSKGKDGGPSRGQQEVLWVRALVAERTNLALAAAGLTHQVSHLSLEAQHAAALENGDLGRAAVLDRLPTQHEGKNEILRETRRAENQEIRAGNTAHFRDTAAMARAEMKAAREGRLMAPSHDTPSLFAPFRKPTHGRRLDAITPDSIHSLRLRHGAVGREPVLSVSAMHNAPIGHGTPTLGGGVLRRDEPGHSGQGGSLHLVPAAPTESPVRAVSALAPPPALAVSAVAPKAPAPARGGKASSAVRSISVAGSTPAPGATNEQMEQEHLALLDQIGQKIRSANAADLAIWAAIFNQPLDTGPMPDPPAWAQQGGGLVHWNKMVKQALEWQHLREELPRREHKALAVADHHQLVVQKHAAWRQKHPEPSGLFGFLTRDEWERQRAKQDHYLARSLKRKTKHQTFAYDQAERRDCGYRVKLAGERVKDLAINRRVRFKTDLEREYDALVAKIEQARRSRLEAAKPEVVATVEPPTASRIRTWDHEIGY